jgi:hypothetical protein
MAFTLMNGASRKTVNAEWQKDELIQRGWTLVGGTAGEETNIHNYTNPTPKDFKGIGFEGEDPKSIGYFAKKLSEGATQKEYEGINDIIHKYGNVVPADGAEIETVGNLSGTGDADKVYLLLTKDTATGKPAGVYVYKNGAWTDYTV